MEDEEREIAKWRRRIEENRYIRENLLDNANLLVYTIQNLSTRPKRLGVVDVYTIWRLLQNGYDVNERDDNGVPPLVSCAIRGWLVVIAMLMKYNCDINITSTFQETAISAACRCGRMQTIRYLLFHHPDLDVCDKSGFSCLRWAAKNQNVELTRILLKKGASVLKDCGTTTHLSALAWAREEKNNKIEDLLTETLIEEKKKQLDAIRKAHKSQKSLRMSTTEEQEYVGEVINDNSNSACGKTIDNIPQQSTWRKKQEEKRLSKQERELEEARQLQRDKFFKTIQPVELEPAPVLAVESQWLRTGKMKWGLFAVPPKSLENQSRVNLKRIQELVDDDLVPSLESMAITAQKQGPKASVKYFCPEYQ